MAAMPARKRNDWRWAAERLGAAVPKEKLHPAVLAWAEASPANEVWAVAFSGGADSLALLLLVWAHWPERRKKLCALHFNHRLRGAAAKRDEVFCGKVAKALGVRWRSGVWAEAKPRASEAAARSARQAFFGGELKRLRGRALWLGHQQDDIAETMLMRLARGSGAAGLAAPRPVQRIGVERVHLRPLLTLKKSELVGHLQDAGVTWREDATNSGGDFFRNRIRRDVLPQWRAAAGERDALAAAALSRELLDEDEEALNAWLREIAPITRGGALSLRRLAGKPRALVRRALQQWLVAQNLAGILSRQGFEALLDDVLRARVTRHSLGAGGFAKIDGRQMKRIAAEAKARRLFQSPAN
jgi:tRNA(Ile)-lysidine synthase